MKACSPPTSPTDAYTPILVAESFGSYGTNSSKQNSEESITITSKWEKDNNGAAKIYTEEDSHGKNERLLSNESNYSADIKSLVEKRGQKWW